MTTWNLQTTEHHVLICNGSSCMRKGGEEATQAIRDKVADLDLEAVIHTTRTRCNGRCKDAPVAVVYPQGTWYKDVTPEVAGKIVEQDLLQGCPVDSHVIYEYKSGRFTAPENTTSIKGVEKPLKKGV